MNPTSPVPRTFTPEEENAQDRSNPAAYSADGLVDAEAAEKFQQAVEQRLSEPAPAETGIEKLATDADDDNPITVDNPE
ncbi:hypothetical protein [Kocuria turfanensis]|uniref:Uncharacterized protein n=1 Tax=Kocuria turfanensis TaxID=388357 RepID=A0A512IHZ0_9MICC|nr:hypothetical protein [Kocuria turfanensis]GEO97336.1 hypothetical protein KTU01_34590 [Kocuria turfanensis]